jgi:hypothetical protein
MATPIYPSLQSRIDTARLHIQKSPPENPTVTSIGLEFLSKLGDLNRAHGGLTEAVILMRLSRIPSPITETAIKKLLKPHFPVRMNGAYISLHITQAHPPFPTLQATTTGQILALKKF